MPLDSCILSLVSNLSGAGWAGARSKLLPEVQQSVFTAVWHRLNPRLRSHFSMQTSLSSPEPMLKDTLSLTHVTQDCFFFVEPSCLFSPFHKWQYSLYRSSPKPLGCSFVHKISVRV